MKLIISIVLLVMIFISYWYLNKRIDETGSATQVFNMDVNPGKLDLKHLEDQNSYNSIVERPLFIEEREFKREVEQKITKKVTPVEKKLNVKALGVAVTNENILAVVKNLTSGKIIRMNVGDLIEGWTLEGVSEDSFIFSKNDQRKIIRFKN